MIKILLFIIIPILTHCSASEADFDRSDRRMDAAKACNGRDAECMNPQTEAQNDQVEPEASKSVSPPASIGGAFLACAYESSQDQRGVFCRLEQDQKKVPVAEIPEVTDIDSGHNIPVILLPEDHAYQWSLTLPSSGGTGFTFELPSRQAEGKPAYRVRYDSISHPKPDPISKESVQSMTSVDETQDDPREPGLLLVPRGKALEFVPHKDLSHPLALQLKHSSTHCLGGGTFGGTIDQAMLVECDQAILTLKPNNSADPEIYGIMDGEMGKILDVPWHIFEKGRRVDFYPQIHNLENQQFRLRYLGDHLVITVASHPDLCLGRGSAEEVILTACP